MPLPLAEALDAAGQAAADKARLAKSNLPGYLVSGALAGAFVGVAVLLLLMTSASFIAAKAPSTKLVQGSVFGVALTLVVFAGAELFTGNVMVMLQGLFARAVSITDLALVWAASLAGNLGGAVLFSALVNASGVITGGAPKGQQTIYLSALEGIVQTKAGLSGGQLFFRAVLCNMLVCLALWMAARATSDAAKLITLFWALLAFVASGFEHSIANMTVFALAMFSHVPGATWGELSRNLLFTVPGNVVGGGLLVAGAYRLIDGREPAAAPMADLPDVVDLVSTPPVRRRRTTPPPSRSASATTQTAPRSRTRTPS